MICTCDSRELHDNCSFAVRACCSHLLRTDGPSVDAFLRRSARRIWTIGYFAAHYHRRLLADRPCDRVQDGSSRHVLVNDNEVDAATKSIKKIIVVTTSLLPDLNTSQPSDSR